MERGVLAGRHLADLRKARAPHGRAAIWNAIVDVHLSVIVLQEEKE